MLVTTLMVQGVIPIIDLQNENATNINDINGLLTYNGGADGTRTRDPRRDSFGILTN